MSKENMQWLRLTTVGTHFLAGMGVGFAIGHYILDPLFGTKPFFTVLMSLFGIGAGFLNLYRELELLNKKDPEGEAVESDPQSKDNAPR